MAGATITVDLVILTVRDETLQLLLVERGKEPFLGRAALPGGFVREGEGLLDAAFRELAEETSLSLDRLHLEQLATFGDPGRDPRGRVVSVAHLAIAPDLPVPTAGTDAAHAYWRPIHAAAPGLPFDHDEIVAHGLERARTKLEQTNLATAFCGETFTMADLRKVYEAVWGQPLDPSNFNRKVLSVRGFIEPTGEKRNGSNGRPAQLYKRGETINLRPPMYRRDFRDTD